MSELISKVGQYFDSQIIDLFIGYTQGNNGFGKPAFFTNKEQLNKLTFNEQCIVNLAVYLRKPELKKYSKIGILANVGILRAILQLAAENQIKDGQYLILTVKDNKVIEFVNLKAIEEWVSNNMPEPNPERIAKMKEFEALTQEERWAFWTQELASCVRCYACRAACPLCYCEQCVVECNQPQWVGVPATGLGNLEWHIVRAMHLAGRCIGCGECEAACPMEIPIGFLTQKLNMEIAKKFGQIPGTKLEPDYALSTFKVDDKENFIR